MKRDFELIRKILFILEEHEHGFAPKEIEIEGCSRDEIGYHAYLMDDAGLIVGRHVSYLESSSPTAIPVKMTWAGHDFLDAARNDSIWNGVRKNIESVGGAVAFELLKAMLIDATRRFVSGQ